MAGLKGRLVYGVGVNDAPYSIQPLKDDGSREYCPYALHWSAMLRRCLSEKFQAKWHTYKGCTFDDSWVYFMQFREWAVNNVSEENAQIYQLDKDILIEGNKHYSPETCVFVHPLVNTFIVNSNKTRSDLPIGVTRESKTGGFISRCQNPITRNRDYLGFFYCPQEAYEAWRVHKLKMLDLLLSEGYIIEDRVYDALKHRFRKK